MHCTSSGQKLNSLPQWKQWHGVLVPPSKQRSVPTKLGMWGPPSFATIFADIKNLALPSNMLVGAYLILREVVLLQIWILSGFYSLENLHTFPPLNERIMSIGGSEDVFLLHALNESIASLCNPNKKILGSLRRENDVENIA